MKKGSTIFMLYLVNYVYIFVSNCVLMKTSVRSSLANGCHPERLQMDSSIHLIHGSLDPHVSAPQTASRSVHTFLHNLPVPSSRTQTNKQTMLGAASVATDSIYALRE